MCLFSHLLLTECFCRSVLFFEEPVQGRMGGAEKFLRPKVGQKIQSERFKAFQEKIIFLARLGQKICFCKLEKIFSMEIFGDIFVLESKNKSASVWNNNVFVNLKIHS